MQSAALLRQVVCPSVCLSVTLRYRDHIHVIGWKSSKIISRSVSLGYSLSADPNSTDLIQRKHPKYWPKVTHPLLNWASQTFCGKLRPNGQWSQWRAIWNHHRLSNDPLRPPFPQNGDPKCTSRDMPNFERPYLRNGSSVPVHVSFYGRFWESADRMALFPVRWNPGWQPAAIWENYSGIARFPCDSTAFLLIIEHYLHVLGVEGLAQSELQQQQCARKHAIQVGQSV